MASQIGSVNSFAHHLLKIVVDVAFDVFFHATYQFQSLDRLQPFSAEMSTSPRFQQQFGTFQIESSCENKNANTDCDHQLSI